MKNAHNWKPTKFVYRGNRLMGSRDPKDLAISSRLAADVVAACYEQNIPKYVTGKLLDLGCGKIPLFATYQRFATENLCVDWANTLHPNDHLDLECDLTESLPFADDAFDTIILSDVLEHIPEPGFLVKEMARVLAPNGKLLLNVPFMYWLHERPHDYYRYTEFALRRFAEQAKLTTIHLSSVGGVPEVLTDIVAKTVARVPLIGNGVARIVQSVVSLLLRTRLGKRISMQTGRLFPMGYFMVLEKAAVTGVRV